MSMTSDYVVDLVKVLKRATNAERGILMRVAKSFSKQTIHRKKRAKVTVAVPSAAPVVARASKDPNRPKRKYTKRAASWKNKGKK